MTWNINISLPHFLLLQLPNQNLYMVSWGSTSPMKMVPSLCGLPPIGYLQNPPTPPPPQSMLFQVLLIWQLRTLMIDKIQSFPLTLDSPAKPDHQGIHCPIANFGLLSTSSITNPILITVFDTYLTPRSPEPWVWTITLSILNVAP